ncbi:MAG: hypothetical protein HY302_14200 [Opitutae bacterium]|nr:hypothetical protein [Opitutae bacterium]
MSTPGPENDDDDSRRESWATQRLHLSRLTSWGGDLFRLLWALLYWNARKSWYRWRGGRRQCPCHDPSDSGRPGETRCVPAMNFNRGSRFRHVCPLLQETGDGWRCSVAPAAVRPFWRRAALIYASLLLGLYLLACAAALPVFHRIGYSRLAYKDVVWPGHWSRFAWIQAKYFRDEGLAALRTGDFARAMLNLSTARQVAPDDYQTGLLLGQLWSATGSFGYSDAVYEILLRDFPAQAEATAISFHDQLLAAQRFDRLAALCLDRLTAGTELTEEWERSLFFAVRHGRLAGKFLKEHQPAVSRLPRRVGFLLQTYALIEQGDRAAAIARLTPLQIGMGSTLFFRTQIETLAGLGRPDEATILLNHYAPALGGGFEVAALQYLITASRGDSPLTQSDFLLLLRRPLTVPQADRICALLIATGDRASLRRLRSFFQQPSLANEGRAYTALWVAALVCGDADTAEFAAAGALRTLQLKLPAVAKIDFLTNAPGNPAGVKALLNTVPLLRDTIFALVAESAERRLRAKPPQSSEEN